MRRNKCVDLRLQVEDNVTIYTVYKLCDFLILSHNTGSHLIVQTNLYYKETFKTDLFLPNQPEFTRTSTLISPSVKMHKYIIHHRTLFESVYDNLIYFHGSDQPTTDLLAEMTTRLLIYLIYLTFYLLYYIICRCYVYLPGPFRRFFSKCFNDFLKRLILVVRYTSTCLNPNQDYGTAPC